MSRWPDYADRPCVRDRPACEPSQTRYRMAMRSIPSTREYWSAKCRRILVEGAKIGSPEWNSVFNRLVDDFAAHADAFGRLGDAVIPADVIDPRELLVWAWCTLMAMPFSIAQDYGSLTEDKADDAGLPRLAANARASGFRFKGNRRALRNQLEWTAALARAADDALSGVSLSPPDPATWTAEAWRPASYPCYVVPIDRESRCVAGKPREQRGIRRHAVIPDQIGTLRVKLRLHPEYRALDAGRLRYGAALFQKLHVEPMFVGDTEFLLSDAPADRWDEQISKHLDAARSHSVDVIAWPELTMPRQRVERLEALRRAAVFENDSVKLIAAGSWHVEDGAGRANRMEVLDGRGHLLLTYDKRIKFPYEGRYEAITPGEEFPVLVTKGRLIGFAICRDFCEDCDINPFRLVGVDLVVVPSMGGTTTTDAHVRHAKSIQSHQGTVAFVVQQSMAIGRPPGAGEPLGASFARPARTADSALIPELEQFVPFRCLMARS